MTTEDNAELSKDTRELVDEILTLIAKRDAIQEELKKMDDRLKDIENG